MLSRDSIVELLASTAQRARLENAWPMLTAPQLGARHSRRLVAWRR
jgi:hypothetical protein